MLTAPLPSLESWTDHFARLDLPVLRRTVARLAELEHREDVDGAEMDARGITAAIGDDPLMALRLFSHLARNRVRSAADVCTVERALIMMGVGPFRRAFGKPTTIEERLAGMPEAHAGLIRVLRRAQRAARFAATFAAWRNDVNVEEIMLAALLHDLAEMLMWCVAPALMLRIRDLQSADQTLRSLNVQRTVLGIDLNDLQLALAARWRLPALLSNLMDDHHASAPCVRNVLLAVRVARHSAKSWDNPALPDDYRDIGELLSVSPARAAELAGAPEAASALSAS